LGLEAHLRFLKNLGFEFFGIWVSLETDLLINSPQYGALTSLALDYLNNSDGIKELVSKDNIARLTVTLNWGDGMACYPL